MNDLDELKTLLFGAEKEVLDSIQQRVQTPAARAADIAAVLPDAIRLRHREGDDLVKSLKDPFGRCLRDSLHESPEEFSDALYPVMGPAIRKSIAHALKTFSEQINQTLEHSFSVKGLKWRIEAARAGIPFGNFVMQQSLLYRVEQAYLISRENGLLVSHVHHDASHIKDSDAVSAMFTAIQDFVKESFSPDRSGRLETADMGDFTLWAVHGPHALLVCVIRGVPPRELRTDLTRVLERLHFRYGEPLRDYSGDTTSVTGIEEELTECLEFEAAQPVTSEKKGPPWPLIIIALLLLGAGAYAAWTAWQQAKQDSRLDAVLSDTPGLYVGEIEKLDDGYRLHGLRDPLAPDLAAIAERAELNADQLSGDLRPYRSLDESIVLRRALQLLEPGPDTTIVLSDDKLVVSGNAPYRWIQATRQKAASADIGWPIDLTDVRIAEWPPLQERTEQLDEVSFFFTSGTRLDAESTERLTDYANELKALSNDATAIGGSLNILITGYTDSSGSASLNRKLAGERAEVVVSALTRAGTNSSQFSVSTNSLGTAVDDGNTNLRRAIVKVSLELPAQ